MSQTCDRCGSPTHAITMSYFNSEIICDECDNLEQLHPEYHRAKAAEAEQVEKGNYKFKGVGLPSGYREWARAKKTELARTEDGPEEDSDDPDGDAIEEIAAFLESLEEEVGP